MCKIASKASPKMFSSHNTIRKSLGRCCTKVTILYILGTYRSPSNNSDETVEIISRVLEETKVEKSVLVIKDIKFTQEKQNINRLDLHKS